MRKHAIICHACRLPPSRKNRGEGGSCNCKGRRHCVTLTQECRLGYSGERRGVNSDTLSSRTLLIWSCARLGWQGLSAILGFMVKDDGENHDGIERCVA
jgi:hypothetical protein